MADRIPLEQIEACYKAGKKFYKNEITLEEAVAEAVRSGIKKDYAQSNIRFLISMLNGELRTRPVINDTIKCYLRNILRDCGEERLKISLKGLKLHIEYRQRKGYKLPGLCDIYNEYSDKAGVPPIF